MKNYETDNRIDKRHIEILEYVIGNEGVHTPTEVGLALKKSEDKYKACAAVSTKMQQLKNWGYLKKVGRGKYVLNR